MRDTLVEFLLLLGPAIAVTLAGTVLAYREAHRRRAPRGELVMSALGAVLRWGLLGCGALAAAAIALKVAGANDQAPLALLATPWVFALGGTFGLWRWLVVRTARVKSGMKPGVGE